MKDLVINKLMNINSEYLLKKEKLINSKQFIIDKSIAILTNNKIGKHLGNIDEIKSSDIYSKLESKYIMENMTNNPYPFGNISLKTINSILLIESKYKNTNDFIKIINKLYIKECPLKFENYLNEYGLFCDRETMYFNNKFNKLNDNDKILIFVQELVQSYAENCHACEGLLALKYFNLIDKKIPYARTKRRKLIEEFIKEYGENDLPILIKKNTDKVKYIKTLIKHKTSLEHPKDKDIYYYYKQFQSNSIPLYKTITLNGGF